MALQIAPADVPEHIAMLARELDIDRPGWADRVDLHSLKMNMVGLDVLCHVYGQDGYRVYQTGWAYGLDRLKERFGPDPGRAEVTVGHQELWVEQIMQRRIGPTDDFTYGLRNQADRARMLQQKGINPPPHRFQPDPHIPHMCCFTGCYATLQSRKSWHLDVFFENV